ncbi:MAG: glycoside hydrolase family 3 protein [Actinomycetota bacterium]|nr:glycoside hydrolase family 3 protein [Actinomycetota bacterium]
MIRPADHLPARLRVLAAGVLAPGFNGTTVPAWLRDAVDGGLGGLVLFGHNLQSLQQTATLTAELQGQRGRGADRVLVASDEEGGDVTRIESGPGSSLPGAAALGAVDDVALTMELATAHGRLLRAIGIDCNLAPVADINSNPDNPVIGIRSFGADAELVMRHSVGYLSGLQAAGVLACTKHFPGHGDPGVDSHLAVPYLPYELDELRRRELVPFAAAVRAGVAAVMPGHLVVPAVDELPASISPRWIEILRQDMGFDGVVVTDALDMRAVAARHGVPGAVVMALLAGADLLCLGNTANAGHPPQIDDQQLYLDCIEEILAAVADGRVSQESLTRSVERRRAAMASIAHQPVPGLDAAAPELRAIGRNAAERAINVDEQLVITAPPAVIDLRTGSNAAAGPVSQRLLDALTWSWPELQLLDRGADRQLADVDRPILVLVRSGAGSPDRAELDEIVRQRPDAVVVDTGWPGAADRRRTVVSYGNAAVNCRVLCERLAGRVTS